ncbi:MAG: Adaptive-response sensory-kinase SasA [bacterium]|nr:Adaptive-response sensory-kinase SasA [bacterium]MCK6562618.1 ATP-binding protein [bacterium]
MNLTIRGRLTIWFTLALSAVLLLVVAVIALKLYTQLDSETREALRSEEQWLTNLIDSEFLDLATAQGEELDSLAADLNENLEERYGLKPQFALVAVQRHHGRALGSGGMHSIEQLVPPDLLERRAGIYTLVVADDHFRVRVFRREWGVAAVGVMNETLFEVAEEAGALLIWILPLAMLLALTGGWLMSKLALRPVAAAARAAESLSLANLRERLPAYAGKDEFGALVATLNRMISRLEEGVKRLQQFTQDAAHELRTPLTVLRGDVELAYQDESTADETRAWLQRILDRVIALGQIVDNLMLLARSDSGDYPIHKTAFRLDLAVKEVFEDLQILAEGRPLTVQLHSEEAVAFFGDESLIRRLLLNLCDNALKYTTQGEITLHLRKVNAHLELMVCDTGSGIPAEELPRIFDRFYRVDKARASDTGGSGLGLAICQWIVAAHGGTIAVTSAPGEGTTVRVMLPITPN